MAAVQLKDLMDPLVKIQKATEDTSQKMDNFIQMLTGSSTVGDSLNQAILAQLEAQTEILKRIASKGGGGGLSGLFKGGGDGNKSSLKEGASALSLLGAGTIEMAKGLLLFTLVPTKTVAKFQDFIIGIFKSLLDYDQKKVKEGASALMLLGDSIMNFSKSLALSALLLIPGIIAIPFLIVSIGIMSGMMLLLGMQERNIKNGAKALDKTGDAIKSFAIGMAFFAVTTFFILMQPKILLGMVASLLLIGGTVAILGLADKTIRKGAAALALMGVGLGLFAIGYGIFALVSSFISLEDVGKQALILVGVGLVTGILGFGLSFIAKGALSLALMGAGLLVFSLGYFPFAKATKGIELGDILIQSGILLAIGMVMTVAGLAVAATGGAALLGPVLFAVIGAGLLVFSLGYFPFAKATKGMQLGDVLVQSGILLAIGTVMTLAGVAVALTAGAALLGPVLFAAAGLSLLFLAPGLKAMKDLNYSKEDGENLALTLGVVAAAFSGADPKEGFLSAVGGLFTRVAQSGAGLAASAMYTAAGLSLISLSYGLRQWKKTEWAEDDSAQLGLALGTITAAFSQAGGEPSNPGGLFGKVFGTAFSPNAVERGISSVMSAGKALTNIARGLTDFNKFANSGVDFDELGINIGSILGVVSKAFAAMVSEGAEGGDSHLIKGGGFLGGLFEIKRTRVEEGIRSVMDAGKALTNITKGLMSFQELVKSGVDFDELGKNIGNILGVVSTAFAAMGGEPVDAGGFFGTLFGIKSTAVEEGIRSVKGAGHELKAIADGLIAFNTLAKTSIPFGDPMAPVEGTLAYAVINTLGFVGKAFAAIGGNEKEDSALFGLIKWDENLVAKGISAVKGAGDELSKIATGLMTFSKIGDPTAVAGTIKSLLESMSGTFASFYDKPEFSTRVTNFSNFITTMATSGKDGSLIKAANGFKKIAEAINSVDIEKATVFKDLFKASAELTEKGRNLKALENLVEAIEDIRDVMQGQATSTDALGGVIEGLKGAIGMQSQASAAPTQAPSLGDSLSRLQATLSQINSTLSNLPADIAAIEIKMPRD